ncbi:MAG: TonB-dependent receptor [Acidobacteria bacterium]|nr:TonB-dependent receptor [Acidobacteriota bacterium]
MHALTRLTFAAALLSATTVVEAQTITGTVTGVVKDASGGALPGATITMAHLQTDRRETAVTDAEGRYTSAPLPLGNYRIEASLAGFRTAAQSGITLTVSEVARVDFVLEVGNVQEMVEVVAHVPLVDPNTSAVGKLVDNRQIAELPLNTRNVYSLIFLTPGVAGTIGNAYGDLRYTINGARPRSSDTLVDGVTATFPTVTGGVGISVFPSVDAIQEFKVLGSTYPAEFGRSLGSIVNVVYKSGSNDFRGSAYEFLRDSAFDARDFFQKRRGEKLGDFSRHQFGGAAGGPLQTGKMFYLASFEGLRERAFASRTLTVPTELERRGDFSRSFAANGQLIAIFNPFTTRPNPSGSGFSRDPFPGNTIPRELWDPVALNVLRYYPLPNQPGDPVTGRNNYVASGTADLNTNNTDVRVDRNFGASGRGFLRYSHRFVESIPLRAFPDDLTIAEGRVIEENRVHNFVAEYNQPFGRSTLLTARIGFARTLFVFNNQGLGFRPSSLGLPASIDTAVDRMMFPRFSAANYASLGGNDHRYNAFMSYPLLVSLTRTSPRHTLKTGLDARMIRVNVWEARAAGTFNFSAGFTQGPNPNTASSTAGHSIASLLLGTGTANNVLIQNWKNVASQNFYVAGYVQDDWRVNERLTLNVGVRYDLETPRTERYDRMNYFDPNARSPLADRVPQFSDLRGGLVFVGVDGNDRWQFASDRDNIAPRIGAALQVNDKTVLRGGYAHLYGPSYQQANGTVGPFGFRTENLWVSTLDGITPFRLLRNPYPDGFRPSPGAAEGLLTGVGSTLQAPLRDRSDTPWNRQWNVTMQRELPWQTAVEIAYVGSEGHNLQTNSESGLNINQLDPKYLALGPALNQLVPNPFFGIVSTGLLVAPQVSRAQLLRPYPQFTDIIPLQATGATSIYHALQLSVNRRMADGLMLAGSYAWSKAIEEGETHQNSYDIPASRSIASYDIPHRLVLSALYEIPFGRTQRFGASAPALIDAVLGGWRINGIITVQSGTPLTITASNTAGLFNPVTRANWNGQDPQLSTPRDERLQRWFDTKAFSQPTPFTFGNAGATFPLLRTDSVRNVDLSVFKLVSLSGRVRLQARIEAFNALNRVQFGSPNTSVTSSSFGVVTGQANTPRQLQFGVKVLW